ncbi:hypothetical protein RM549_13745 [Salegentibacter sp. F188]|uniref:Dihydroorotase n=1 Tax=Autumnicola patrickiae TaxID=3075591 RepID=A0ABU3E4G0_9FLAO|nr:hypothetical protein [Salegentibacter sp. F188]MDT0690856.1 hypothetical protein [Salegentibacter sp. F188]
MKKLLIFTLSLFLGFQMQAQEIDNNNVEVGTILEINEAEAYGFKHIHFPRPNFIIKRGGIANYNSVEGNRVEITAVTTKKDGTREVELKRVDGRKFFRNFATVKADIDEALESGEMTL